MLLEKHKLPNNEEKAMLPSPKGILNGIGIKFMLDGGSIMPEIKIASMPNAGNGMPERKP